MVPGAPKQLQQEQQRSQITITSIIIIIIIMKHKFEILRELPNVTQGHEVSKHSREMAPVDLLRAGLPQTFNLLKKKKISRSSHCGSVETNLISIHEASGLIPGLAQWVKVSGVAGAGA